MTQSHEGYFLCQAKNEIGAGLSKLIRLTVHGMFNFNKLVSINNSNLERKLIAIF